MKLALRDSAGACGNLMEMDEQTFRCVIARVRDERSLGPQDLPQRLLFDKMPSVNKYNEINMLLNILRIMRTRSRARLAALLIALRTLETVRVA